MVDEQLRRRLESLNRGYLPAPGQAQAAANSASALAARDVAPVADSMCAGTFCFARGLLRSAEVVSTARGEHVRIRLPLELLWKGGSSLTASRQEYLQLCLKRSLEAIEPTIVVDAEFAALISALPEQAIVLDLETCGFAGSALFLAGLLRYIDGDAVVELLLARNYAEEAAVLETLWQTIGPQQVLVTFNGKCFDWPMILDRTVRHRLNAVNRAPGRHLDILHHARRRWRKQLPDCRLQTLERHVCRRRREADIPGYAIPAVYAHYVRTGFERDMEIVLYHNALDLVTLFDLALRLAA